MINEIMNKKIICGNEFDSIKKIAHIMKTNNIGFVPISSNKKIIGVVTDRDIALSLTIVRSINDNIEKIMNKSIVSIDKTASILDAVNLMKKNKIKRLLVKDNEKYIGIISISDILKHIDDNILINAYECIFEINDNNGLDYNTEIDEFYL